MPTLKASIPHKLGADEAKHRISTLISDARAKFGTVATDVEENWNGSNADFRFKAMGFPVSGKLQVEPTVVHLEVDLPFAALPLKGRIEQQLTTEARKLLA